jgi:hypothetical protein
MSALRKLGKTRTDGSDLLGANAGVTAGLPCSWQKQDYPGCHHSGCSQGSSLYELIQQTGYKPVDRIDYIGENATTVAGDHPRSRRKLICRGFGRRGGFRQKMKSIRYDRGRILRNIHDKKSIYISTAHDSSLLVFIKGCTNRISWHIASELIRGKEIF